MAFRFTGFADEADNKLSGQIAATKAAGWSSIELRGINGTHVCDQSDDAWKLTFDTLQASGISVAGFGGQVANWARPITSDFIKDLAEIRRVAPRMRQAGTKLLRCMSYPNTKENPWPLPRWRKAAIERLSELARVAADEGIILAHENCNGYGGIGPAEFLELVAGVDNPAFKLIFDTGNNSEHDQTVEATWKYYAACRAHIVHVHIKAYKPGADGKLATCFPDEDPVQRRILADLKRTGYDGYLSIEPHLHAAVHAGKDVADAAKATWCYVEYARRIEAMVAGL